MRRSSRFIYGVDGTAEGFKIPYKKQEKRIIKQLVAEHNIVTPIFRIGEK